MFHSSRRLKYLETPKMAKSVTLLQGGSGVRQALKKSVTPVPFFGQSTQSDCNCARTGSLDDPTVRASKNWRKVKPGTEFDLIELQLALIPI